MKRTMIAALAMTALLVPGAACAAANPQFDVDAATRAYMALLQGPARAKSDAYFEGGYWLVLWGSLVGIAAYWIMLRTGLAARYGGWAERVTKRWVAPGLFAIPFTITIALIVLPWTIYSGFVREGQYGLMNQSFAGWLGDQGIALGIGIVVNAILFVLLFAVIRRFRRTWWLWGAGVMTMLVAVGALLFPLFVAPLFNHYTELPAGPLRDRIVAVAKANNIPAEHIWVADESKQSKRISANVAGLGPTARISLNDNLLNRTGPDETVAVLGHEMGHYVLGHVSRMIAMMALVFLFMFGAIYWAAPRLIARHPAWRVRDVADPAAAAVLLLLFAIVQLVLTPVQNTIVRTQESEADAWGVNATHQPDAFARVAIRLSEYRKLQPGRVEEFLFFDHPSGENRVRMMMQWKKDNVPNAQIVAAPSLAPGQ